MHYTRLRRGHDILKPPQKEYGKTAEDRFWRQIEFEPNSGCWLWSGSIRSKGYGALKVGDQTIGAHRFSWELHNGPIPDGAGYHGNCVLHRCDTMACCNPAHLYLGTPKENARDVVVRNRSRSRLGTENSASKLSPGQVIEIRKLLSDGMKQADVGQRFGVSQSTIGVINTRKIWAWLT